MHSAWGVFVLRFWHQERSLLPTLKWARTNAAGVAQVIQHMFAPRKWLTVATQTTISHPIGESSVLLPMGPHTTYDGIVTKMLYRIELTADKAIETSAELWPNQIRDIRDATAYFQWHQKVCLGGIAHLSGGLVSQDGDLHIRAKSITGLAEGLISMVDHFHRCSASLPDPLPVVTTVEEPKGVYWSPISSLENFFKSPRVYVV